MDDNEEEEKDKSLIVFIKRAVNYIPDYGNIYDETYEETLAGSCRYCCSIMVVVVLLPSLLLPPFYPLSYRLFGCFPIVGSEISWAAWGYFSADAITWGGSYASSAASAISWAAWWNASSAASAISWAAGSGARKYLV
jgi:hypothetical protein